MVYTHQDGLLEEFRALREEMITIFNSRLDTLAGSL